MSLDLGAGLVIHIDQPVAPVVQLTPPDPSDTLVVPIGGPPGPIGPVGGAGYSHTQATPAASWPVTHGLGRYPQATVLDTAGRRVIADLEFPTANTCSVTHAAPMAGSLHLQ